MKSAEEEGKRNTKEKEIRRRKVEIRIGWTLESPKKSGWSMGKYSLVNWLELPSQSKSATEQIWKENPNNYLVMFEVLN